MRCLLLLEVKKIGEEPCLVDPIWKDQHSSPITDHGSSQPIRNKSGREGQWCTFCNKPRHTKETCFKLHGKEAVLNKLGGFKNIRTQGPPQNYPQSYLSNKEQEGEVEKEERPSVGTGMDFSQLNKEEFYKLKEFLKTIQDGGGSCSMAQQGKQISFTHSLASKTGRNNT